MTKKLTIAEGAPLLLESDEDKPGINDLVTYKRQLVLDVSFAIADGPEVEGGPGISVILSSTASDDVEPPEDDEDPPPWNFSRTIVPREGESLHDLATRIANELGIEPEEHIWEDADEQI